MTYTCFRCCILLWIKLDYCTNPINSSVMHHRGSKIDEILRGHRSQGPAMKPPGQTEDEQNWVPLILEIDFFPPLSLSVSMDRVWNLTICYSFTSQGSPSFRWNFLAVTLSLVKWQNQNFIATVTGHRVQWIDWISTILWKFNSLIKHEAKEATSSHLRGLPWSGLCPSKLPALWFLCVCNIHFIYYAQWLLHTALCYISHYGALSKRGVSSNCLWLCKLYQVWGTLSLSAANTGLTFFQDTTCWCTHEYSHHRILMPSMRNPPAKGGINGCCSGYQPVITLWFFISLFLLSDATPFTANKHIHSSLSLCQGWMPSILAYAWGFTCWEDQCTQKGGSVQCVDWTGVWTTPKQHTHTHFKTFKTLIHFHPLYVCSASSLGFSRY